MKVPAALAIRRAIAALVVVATVLIAAEIPVHAHRYSQCVDVSSGGCQSWIYSGTPYWAIGAAIVVGLLGLGIAALVHQPRPLRH